MLHKMKQLMEVRKQAEAIKKQLESITVDVNEVNGIKIVITGTQNFRSVEIDENIFQSGNKKRFESDLLKSMNAAIQKSQSMAAKQMAAVMPGL